MNEIVRSVHRVTFSSYFKDKDKLRHFFHCVLKILNHRYHTKLIWWSIIERIYTLKDCIARKGDNYLRSLNMEQKLYILQNTTAFVKRSNKKISYYFSRPLLCQWKSVIIKSADLLLCRVVRRCKKNGFLNWFSNVFSMILRWVPQIESLLPGWADWKRNH